MHAKLLSLPVDAPSYTGTAEIFGRGWARARMWEQYADLETRPAAKWRMGSNSLLLPESPVNPP
jgi:hypothetical protein